MKKIAVIIYVLISFNSVAQFRLHTKWTNSSTYSSGVDAGVVRIAREIIFPSNGLNSVKMVDPYTLMPVATKPILKFDFENGYNVNNLTSFYLREFDAANNRYVIAVFNRGADFTKNNRRYGKGLYTFYAFYKNNFDSTKLGVVEKNYEVSWTVDNKMPSVQAASASMDMFNTHAIFKDSVVFTAAPGTNTGNNVYVKDIKNAITKLGSPLQSITVKNMPIINIPEPNDDEPLNANRRSTSFNLKITHIENLVIDTDDEKQAPADMKNKGEYYGDVNAVIQHNSRVIATSNFFSTPSNQNSYSHFTYWNKNEKRVLSAIPSITFVVPRAEFENAKLYFKGLLNEGDVDTKLEIPYTAKTIINSADNSRNIFLKNLISGENYYDISAGGVTYWRIYFTIVELN